MERIELPWDLIEEILSRVPTKSLARLQSTSRRWNALSKSGSFALKHSANAPKESLSIMLIDSRVCLVRINVNGIHENVAPSVKVAAQFDLEDPLSSSSQVDIREVFHCDGLLLCSTMDDRLVVWNPCLGETKWVKPRVSYKKRDDNYALGYENKSSCKHYKILRVDYKYPDRSEFEIYDFTSDSWRVIGPSDWALPGRGISVRGNTYWTAFNYSCSIPYCLVSFDFSTEKFESSSLPKFDFRVAVLSLVREEQIFLLGSDCAYKFFLYG